MAPIRVALIEDHDLTRMGLQTMLSQQIEVEVIGEAASGTEGLKLLMRARPDVAIVDINLPGIDGIELVRQFRESLTDELADAAQTKVLMLTMQDNEADILAAFAAGADSYCMKNVDADHLFRAIQSTHEGNNWIDPAIARVVLEHTSQVQAKNASTAAPPNTIEITADNEHSDVLAVAPLSVRELEVLQLIVEGCSNAEIGERCYITVGTVKTHVRNILNKLSVDDRTQAAVRALRGGLVT
ncbi:response regulator transcription factor [Oculatella sp. FACHB-28]|uniref:response regulator n=1 Tax=Oculatella sp. FACHB-28 TaxID=2692845 RepID=UPI00168798E2|nr:response regulator transcription factor [Oculatella sp. FACHB-28]MBD2054601.1 response regulator transcription factor [Oculatella sp. FACHB-28]